jgi:hypothetical protein
MRDPELVARARYAATRLEQAWERWRTVHGLAGSADPLASYVGYSLREPMGQPRVVIGVDAAEAERFADFLDSHECGGHAPPGPLPVNGTARPATAGVPAPRDLPSELTGRPLEAAERIPADSPAGADRATAGRDHPALGTGERPARGGMERPGPDDRRPERAEPAPRGGSQRRAERGAMRRAAQRGNMDRGLRGGPERGREREAERASSDHAASEREVAGSPAPQEAPVANGFHQAPVALPPTLPAGPPEETPEVMAAELAGWASGELPGQASEQLAAWADAAAAGRKLPQ